MGRGVVFEGGLNPSTNYVLVHNFLSALLRLLMQGCTTQNPHKVSDLSKLDIMMHKTHFKFLLVLMYQASIYVDP